MSYAFAWVAPLAFPVCGASAKKLARGSPWVAEDFFLGVEFALATLAASLITLFNVDKSTVYPASRIAAGALFFITSFFLLLWMQSIRQDWRSRPQNRKGQLFWLLAVCNLVGAGLMMAFIVFLIGARS